MTHGTPIWACWQDFRHARQWADFWEVAERRGPTLFKGVLTDGDLEGVSILVDHLAVVALDSSDLQQVPVAGQAPPGGIILGRTEDLVPPLVVAGSHLHDLPNRQSVPPFGECLVKLRKVNASIIGVEVQVKPRSLAHPRSRKDIIFPSASKALSDCFMRVSGKSPLPSHTPSMSWE